MKWIIVLVMCSGILLACPSDDSFKHSLKKGLFDYLKNPEYSRLTVHEVKDMLIFYLTEDVTTLDCNAVTGAESGVSMGLILQKADALPRTIVPTCSDMTLYGECAEKKPKFCYSGMLKDMCYGPDMMEGTDDDCGCDSYEECQEDGTCKYNSIACMSDANCGASGFVGMPYCAGTEVLQYYTAFRCENPGTSQAYCTYSTEQRSIANCTVCTDGACT